MIKINLLPKDARKRVGLIDQIVIIVLVLAVTFTAIGFWWRYLDGIIAQKRTEINKTQQRLAELEKVIQEIKKFEKQRAALQKKLKIIAELKKEQQVPVHLLDEVYLTLIDDMWLNNFRISGDKLSFRGTALSNPVVANYTRNLEKSQYFDGVKLAFSQQAIRQGQEIRNFSLSATLTVPKDFLAAKFKPEEGN